MTSQTFDPPDPAEIKSQILSLSEQQQRDLNREDRPGLCVDCQHIAKSSLGDPAGHKCRHPNNYAGISMVDGEIVFKANHCESHRMTNDPKFCGIIGRWWEKRKEVLVTSNFGPLSPLTPVKPLLSIIRRPKLTSSDLDNL